MYLEIDRLWEQLCTPKTHCTNHDDTEEAFNLDKADLMSQDQAVAGSEFPLDST